VNGGRHPPSDAALIDNLRDAESRLAGVAHRTQTATCAALDRAGGRRVFLKCENLQRGGAFKFRGAFNTVAQLEESARRRGIAAFSSGNHAQAAAIAGGMFSAPVHLVMPEDASPVKVNACRGYGARVTLCKSAAAREQVCAELAARDGLTVVPPFDHPHIIAGQGTAALELLDDAADLDEIVVPCGGGGLLSGCAVAAKHKNPKCKVIGVEPQLGDDGVRSFTSGVLQTAPDCRSIADGARTPSLGELNFAVIRRFVDDMLSVSEEEIKHAVRFLFHRAKLVVEPSGALAAAALLAHKLPRPFMHQRCGIVLSGGNVDGAVMAAILAPAAGGEGGVNSAA